MGIIRKYWGNFATNDEKILHAIYVHHVTRYYYDKMSRISNVSWIPKFYIKVNFNKHMYIQISPIHAFT